VERGLRQGTAAVDARRDPATSEAYGFIIQTDLVVIGQFARRRLNRSQTVTQLPPK
jgi:hypothetical protein